jgi:hypothetical protein
MSHRVPLLGVDEIWKQDWVPFDIFIKCSLYGKIFKPNEEDWSVVANDIPVSLFRVELYCKSSRIPGMNHHKDENLC